MNVISNKKTTAWLSIASNTFLTVLKLITGVITGSISILSEAAHSAIDLLASIIATFSVYAGDRPPDKTHQYGHEKIENVSGVVEGLLIFVAAIWIILESYKKLLHGVELKYLGPGVFLMALSAGLNLCVATLLKRSAVKNRSVALEADAMHLYSDVYTSLGVFIGLSIIALVKIFWGVSISWVDPIVAIVVAILILSTAYKITVKSFLPLLDTSASADDLAIINNIMDEFGSRDLDFHKLRTRMAGGSLYIDLHMGCRPGISLEFGHSFSHELKARIEESLPGAKVLIHVEPSECIEFLPDNDIDINSLREELIKDIHVREVRNLKGIRYKNELRVEAELLLDPDLSLSESNALVSKLAGHLKNLFPHVKETVLTITPGGVWQKAIHEDDKERIINLVGEHQGFFASIHKLDIASSGITHRIYLALGVPHGLPVFEASQIARHIKADIKMLFPEGANIDIHIEPCNKNCVSCSLSCE